MRLHLAALVVALAVPQTAAQFSEVRVMSSGATAHAYLELIQPFESTTKLKAVTLATSNGVVPPTSRRAYVVAKRWTSCSCRPVSWRR